MRSISEKVFLSPLLLSILVNILIQASWDTSHLIPVSYYEKTYSVKPIVCYINDFNKMIRLLKVFFTNELFIKFLWHESYWIQEQHSEYSANPCTSRANSMMLANVKQTNAQLIIRSLCRIPGNRFIFQVHLNTTWLHSSKHNGRWSHVQQYSEYVD